MMFRHVLVAYDGSQISERAFRAGVEMAQAFGGRVRVVSVIPVPASPLGNVIPVAVEDERAWVANALAELTRSVPAGVCAIETDIVFGAPAAALLDQAREHDVDHIVLGRTGKGAMERVLIGSVSREVANHAKVAVTLVP